MKKLFINRLSEKKYLLLVTLLILGIRIGYILTLEEKWYFYDTIHYDKAATHLLNGEGFGTSIYFSNIYEQYCLEPVYPLFLASVYGVFGRSFLAVRITQAILGWLLLFLLYQLGREVMPRSWARWTMVVGAFYPFFIYIAGLLYITQLFSMFIVLSIWLFVRYLKNHKIRWLVLAGIVSGIAVLSRPIYLIAVPLLLIWILFFSNQKASKRIIATGILALVFLLFFTPWTVRNYLLFNEFKFARAAMPQDQVYSLTFWGILREKAMEKDSVDIQSFGFSYKEVGDKGYLECTINGDYFFTLNPYEKLTIPDSSYVGVLFAGRHQTRIEGFTALDISINGQDTVRALLMDSQDSLAVLRKHKSIQYNPPAIDFAGVDNIWDFGIYFADATAANYFEISYPSGVKPGRIHNVALLVFLDSPDENANGYMVWLHPWREPDLWWYKDGKPYDSIPVIKRYAGHNQIGLFYLLYHYPFDYIFKHFTPEFIKFWSPKVIRIFTEGSEPGPLLQVVSVVSFTPLLLLLPFGIWYMRKHWRYLLLYVIPVITISCGYSLFFTQTRYRIPVDAFLILFAVFAVYALVTKFKKTVPEKL